MKRIILMVIPIVASIILGCSSLQHTDAEEYSLQETNDIDADKELEQVNEMYEDEHLYEVLIDPSIQPKNAISVSAASAHTLAIMEDNSLWSWGRGESGWGEVPYSPIGDGTIEHRLYPVQIMEDVVFALAGHSHSLAITTDGGLWTWGDNTWGQLGDESNEIRLSPVRVMDDVIYATLPLQVPNSHTGGGSWRSYAITSDRILWAWGYNEHREVDIVLGDGSRENRYSPTKILEDVLHVLPTRLGGLAITEDNVLWRWRGRSQRYCEDTDRWVEIEAQLYPIPIMEDVAFISSTGGLAITTEGELWELGHEPTWIMDNVIYAAGSNFAITEEGTLWAWGQNRLPTQWRVGSVLGDGTTTDRDEPVRILDNVASVTTVGNSTYAITEDGNLWWWGMGTIPSVYSVAQEHMWEYAYERGFPSGIRWISDDEDDTGIHLSPVRILENVISVHPTYFMLDHGFVRGFRTFARSECGAVWAWGNNDIFDRGLSLLGDGTSEYQSTPIRIIESR